MPSAPKTFRPRHLTTKPRRWPKRQQKTTERGYGHDWQRLRTVALQRDHYLCVPCRDRGHLVEAEDVDHIIPFNGLGDPLRLDLDNLRSVCKACHRSKTRRGPVPSSGPERP